MSGHHDIFLCHDPAAAAAAKRLSSLLAARGLSCHTFEGHSAPEIHPKLAISKVFLGYASEGFFESRGCQIHLALAWFAAQQDHPDRPSRVLLINPEPAARHIYPLELRDKLIGDFDSLANAPVLASLIEEHCRETEGPIGAFYGEPPAPCTEPFNLHDRPAEVFAGRNRELWDLHNALQSSLGPSKRSLAILSAQGGYGKTQLALEYAFRFAMAYPGGIFRLSGKAAEACFKHADLIYNPALKTQLLGLLRRLQPECPPAEDAPLKDIRADIERVVTHSGLPFLWIVDDVPDGLNGPVLDQWLAPFGPDKEVPLGRTLLISQSQRYDGRGESIHLPLLEESAGLALVSEGKKPHREEELDALSWLTVELGRHPFYAGLLRGLLESSRPGKRAYSRLAQSLSRKNRAAQERVLQWPKAFPAGSEKVAATLLLESLQGLEGAARDILRLAVEISSDPIPLSLVRESLIMGGMSADDRKEDLFTIFLNEPEEIPLEPLAAESYVEQGARQLERRGLAQRLGERLEIPPLVIKTYQAIAPPTPRQALLAESALLALYRVAEQCHASSDWIPLMALGAHAKSLLDRLRDHPVSADDSAAEITGKIRLALHLADLDLRLGARQRALEAFRATSAYLVRAMAVDPQNGARQRDFARVQEQLGDLSNHRSDLQTALDHFRKSLGIRAFLAKQDPLAPQSLEDCLRLNQKIASIQGTLGDSEAAFQTQQAIHALHTRNLEANPEHPELQFEVASSHARLGELLISLRQTEEGLREFKKALPQFETLAEAFPDSIRYGRAPTSIYNRIGDILHGRDDLTGALGRYRAALQSAERVLAAHPDQAELWRDVALCLDNLGDTFFGLDDPHEANQAFQRFLEMAESETGQRAFQGLRARQVASAQIKLGRIRELEKSPRRALERYLKAQTLIERLAHENPTHQRLREDYQWLRHKISRLTERLEADSRRLARQKVEATTSQKTD